MSRVETFACTSLAIITYNLVTNCLQTLDENFSTSNPINADSSSFTLILQAFDAHRHRSGTLIHRVHINTQL